MSNEEDSSTSQVLELIGLAQDEVDTYFKITGRGPVMIGEIALLVDITEERVSEITDNLYQKGLIKRIPGKALVYEALPPYAALLNQIHQFKEAIKEFQQSVPIILKEKFDSMEKHSKKLKKLDEYRTYIQIMKTKLPAQIKTQFDRFEKELDQVKKFQAVRDFILNLKEITPSDINREFEVMETRLETIKAEISNKFEKQFRIGALKSMAEKIVSRVISEQFRDITNYFRQKFVQTTENMLDQVINQLGTITDTAGEISTDLGSIFVDIETGLKNTLEDLDNRVAGVYDDILTGIDDLKNMFQNQIFKTIQDDIINNIINQLEGSELTMNEFWERSKQASVLSFKDVWFVRSVEGIRAQINESLSRVKMRVHIIVPRLENIDLVALSQLKKHINIRISTNFDLNNPEHQTKLMQIEEISNITIRHYSVENLWSINKDFEEVIVCVVSRTGEGEIEIAGMGSVLEEHVKLFAAMLEDVWIQSKKIEQVGIQNTIRKVSERSLPKQLVQTPILPKMTKTVDQIPSTIPPKPSIPPEEIMQPEVFKQEEPPIEPVGVKIAPEITKTVEQIPSTMPPKPLIPPEETVHPEIFKQEEPSIEPVSVKIVPEPTKIVEQIPSIMLPKPSIPPKKTVHPEIFKQEETPIEPVGVNVQSEVLPSTTSSSDASLSNQFDNLLDKIEKMTGNAIASTLNILQDDILEKIGFSAVLRQMRISSSALKYKKNLLDSTEKEELLNKINIWRNKLKI